MAPRPDIKPGDWIRIRDTDCVVAVVRAAGDQFGDCEVVFNPTKPTNHDVEWTGEEWVFAKRGDEGGYAEKYSRLRAFVQILKKGRYHRGTA